MLYELNGKIYVKPFSSRLVEIKISKDGNNYDVKATGKTMEITSEIRNKLTEVALKDAYDKTHKIENKSIDML